MLQRLHRTAVRARTLQGQARLTHGADTYYKKERTKATREHGKALIAAEQIIGVLEAEDDDAQHIEIMWDEMTAFEYARWNDSQYDDNFDPYDDFCLSRS